MTTATTDLSPAPLPAEAAAGPAPLAPAREAALRDLFERQIPLHAHLGLRVEQLAAGAARVRLPPRPELTGDPFRPAVHGGVLATLADVAGGLAVFGQVAAEDRVSTIDLRIDYLRPAATGLALVGEARLLRAGGRVAMAEVTLHQGDLTQPCARAAVVYAVHRGKGAP
ncbi:MAG: hypothetical protein RL071_4789 [Pseudomonadota bacterium]|jgi:uncharacterized protein (TIGR00369 family)